MTRARAAFAALALVVVVAACSGDSDDDAGPPPSTEPTSTTTPIDLSTVQLAGVPGTTSTTVVLRPGDVTLGGVVVGPEGPVPGATVQVTRLVAGGEAAEVVGTGPDGRWEMAGILGGRYRVRAWRAPDLAQTDPVIQFVESGSAHDVDLRLEAFGGLQVLASLAPETPAVDEPIELAVKVADRQVDDSGVVRGQPRVGAVVELHAASAWRLESPNPVATDGAGEARWILRCTRAGEHGMSVVVDGVDVVGIPVPGCTRPEPTTTSTSTPRGSTSSSSSTSTTSTTEG